VFQSVRVSVRASPRAPPTRRPLVRAFECAPVSRADGQAGPARPPPGAAGCASRPSSTCTGCTTNCASPSRTSCGTCARLAAWPPSPRAELGARPPCPSAAPAGPRSGCVGVDVGAVGVGVGVVGFGAAAAAGAAGRPQRQDGASWQIGAPAVAPPPIAQTRLGRPPTGKRAAAAAAACKAGLRAIGQRRAQPEAAPSGPGARSWLRKVGTRRASCRSWAWLRRRPTRPTSSWVPVAVLLPGAPGCGRRFPCCLRVRARRPPSGRRPARRLAGSPRTQSGAAGTSASSSCRCSSCCSLLSASCSSCCSRPPTAPTACRRPTSRRPTCAGLSPPNLWAPVRPPYRTADAYPPPARWLLAATVAPPPRAPPLSIRSSWLHTLLWPPCCCQAARPRPPCRRRRPGARLPPAACRPPPQQAGRLRNSMRRWVGTQLSAMMGQLDRTSACAGAITVAHAHCARRRLLRRKPAAGASSFVAPPPSADLKRARPICPCSGRTLHLAKGRQPNSRNQLSPVAIQSRALVSSSKRSSLLSMSAHNQDIVATHNLIIFSLLYLLYTLAFAPPPPLCSPPSCANRFSGLLCLVRANSGRLSRNLQVAWDQSSRLWPPAARS